MSREKSWQVPGKGAIFTVPQWVEENCEVISREKFKLPDGVVASSGDWLVLRNGKLTKK